MRQAAAHRLSTSAKIGMVMMLCFVAARVLGPVLAPYSPTEQNLLAAFAPPSAEHWLGTDHRGIDVVSQMLYGARVALTISGTVVFLCAVIGVGLGIISGYFGGKIDELLMRIVDILMAFPGLLLNIAIVATMSRPGVGVLIFVLALNGWVSYARVARGQVLSLRERDYVHAAQSCGASSWRIMLRHILPNLLSPVIVQMTFGFGTIILVEVLLRMEHG